MENLSFSLVEVVVIIGGGVISDAEISGGRRPSFAVFYLTVAATVSVFVVGVALVPLSAVDSYL